jgi:DNA-binding LytR/AlgR family response regulator
MMRVLLVDGEPLALHHVAMELRSLPDVDIVGFARDGDAALDELRRLSPDLIILDVEMPGRGGLSVAAELMRKNDPDIVFVSAVDRHVAMAFEIEAIDYLTKLLRPNRLKQAIERVRRRQAEKAVHAAFIADCAQCDAPPTMHIPDRNGGHDLPVSEIVWIEALGDYALIHTNVLTTSFVAQWPN